MAVKSNFYKGNEVYISTHESLINSTKTALGSSETFTGTYENALGFTTVVVSCKSDAEGTLFIDFSTDGINTDSTLTYSVTADVNEIHRLVIGKKYYRVRYTNGTTAQSFLRLQALLGNHSPLNSSLNSTIQQDADAQITRSITEELSIAEGKYSGISIVNKFGFNSDVDSATVPEDVWEGGGTYTGWATAAELVQVFSASTSDTAAGVGARTLRIIGLDANYDVQSETITLNGTTPVSSTQTFIRIHTASVLTAGTAEVNQGIITVRQATTTANVFLSLIAGRNQSNAAVYTVPAGYTAYMRNIHAAASPTNTASVQGQIWTRSFGGAFRSRRPFFISNAFRLYDTVYGGLVFTEKSDITIRIISCSANNVAVNAGFDLILVRN